jgi:hypothetical protein
VFFALLLARLLWVLLTPTAYHRRVELKRQLQIQFASLLFNFASFAIGASQEFTGVSGSFSPHDCDVHAVANVILYFFHTVMAYAFLTYRASLTIEVLRNGGDSPLSWRRHLIWKVVCLTLVVVPFVVPVLAAFFARGYVYIANDATNHKVCAVILPPSLAVLNMAFGVGFFGTLAYLLHILILEILEMGAKGHAEKSTLDRLHKSARRNLTLCSTLVLSKVLSMAYVVTVAVLVGDGSPTTAIFPAYVLFVGGVDEQVTAVALILFTWSAWSHSTKRVVPVPVLGKGDAVPSSFAYDSTGETGTPLLLHPPSFARGFTSRKFSTFTPFSFRAAKKTNAAEQLTPVVGC